MIFSVLLWPKQIRRKMPTVCVCVCWGGGGSGGVRGRGWHIFESLKQRTLMPGGDFCFVFFYNFYNEMGKQTAVFKENLLVG